MSTISSLKSYRYLSLILLLNLAFFIFNLIYDTHGAIQVMCNCLVVFLTPVAFNLSIKNKDQQLLKNTFLLPTLFCITEILLNTMVDGQYSRTYIIIRMIYFIVFLIVWISTFFKEGVNFSNRKRYGTLKNLVMVLIPLSILWLLISENQNDELIYLLAMTIAILSTFNFNIILNRKYTNGANYTFGFLGGTSLMSISFFSATYFYLYNEMIVMHFTKFMFYNTIIFYMFGIDCKVVLIKENEKVINITTAEIIGEKDFSL